MTRRLRWAACLGLAACDWHTVDAIDAIRPGTGALCEVPYVDPAQQTLLGPGDRSHWLQPWRAWTDTFPAKRMRDALGITSTDLKGATASARLQLAQESGLARIYTGANWGDAEFDAPNRLSAADRTSLRDYLTLLKARKLRPHLLVLGHHGGPCPMRGVDVRVVTAAPAGARQLKIDPAGVAQLAPGRTGIDKSGRAAGVLFTAVSPDGTVTLSKPLPDPIPVGNLNVTVLRFPPFQRPIRGDGTPNPIAEQTLQGWEQFLTAVVTEVRAVLGSDGWDIEIWNELAGGSDFLDANAYYETPIDDGPGPAYELVSRAILERTVAFFRNPANGVMGARVLSGFSNTRYTDAGSTMVPGVAMMSRHLSVHGTEFGQPTPAPAPVRSLRADGQPNGARGADGVWREAFTPMYTATFPEQALNPILYPRVIFPDLSPIPSNDAAGNVHGRLGAPAGGAPPAVGLSSISVTPGLYPFRSGDTPAAQAALWRFKVKAALRAAAAYVGKGAEELIFYTTTNVGIDLVDEADAATGGPVLQALKRFTAPFAGPDTIAAPRPLTLQTVGSCSPGTQFDGNGTSEYPPLLDTAVVAFFPFQVDDARYVVPTYVMTRDIGKVYRPELPATDPARHDMPPQKFTLKLAGLRSSSPRMQLTDPVTGDTSDVRITARAGATITVEVALTDYPRLLTITDQ